MKQQAGRTGSFRTECQSFAEGQHVGRQIQRHLGEHAVKATSFKTDLEGSKSVEHVRCRDDDELRRIQSETTKTVRIRQTGFEASATVLDPKDGAALVRQGLRSRCQSGQRCEEGEGKPGGCRFVAWPGRMQRMQPLTRFEPPESCYRA